MKIPGFSFWALVTAALLFLLLIAVGESTEGAIIYSVIWYLIGYGNAYAVRKFHYPEVEIPADIGNLSTAPPGMYAVTFVNQNRTVFVPAGGNLLKAAKDQGAEIYYDLNKWTNCFGHGFCGTCRFTPDPKATDALSDPTWQERFTLGDQVEKVRLACQTSVYGDCVIDNAVAEEFGETRRYSVVNGVLLGAFSLVVLGAILWIGADMISLL